MNEHELDPDELVTVYTLNDYFLAEIIRNALRSEGMHCDLDGERQAGLSDILTIGVVVHATPIARKIIMQHEKRD